MKNKSILLVLSLLMISSFSWGIDFAKGEGFAGCVADSAVLTVNADGSGDCETIQDAIDNVAEGGLISVGDGTYTEILVIDGKTFTLQGNVESPSSVILDANYLGSGIDIQNIDATSNSLVIEGFTIMNGRALNGAGVYVYNSHVDINSCIFHSNDATGAGGAVSIIDPSSDITIEKSDFYSNIAMTGGVIYSTYMENETLTLKNNLFYDNNSNDNGGVIYSAVNSYPHIYNNTFVNNDADNNGGAIYLQGDSSNLKIINNVFYDNSANANSDTSGQGGAIYIGSYLTYGTVDYNSFYNNDNYDCYIHGSSKSAPLVGANNITYDPLLTDIENDDFSLTSSSPLVDTGSDLAGSNVLDDYLGVSRPNGVGYDIGAYEYSDAEEAVTDDTTVLETTYCSDNGGTVEERTYEGGDTYSVCTFSDGSECKTELFYTGSCNVGDSIAVEPETYENTVNIEDFMFDPSSIEIIVGETVTWTNNDSASHQIVIDDYLTGDSFANGESYSYTFDTEGTYVYYCGLHPSMTGTVTVISDDSDIACGDFPDVNSEDFSTEECAAISWVQDEGIFTGNDETGELKPADDINRAETTKVLIEAFGFDSVTDASTYSDVSDNAWYTPYIMAATANGIVEGYADGSFKPESTVNKVEMLKIILETAGVDLSGVDTSEQLFSDIAVDESTDWYRKYAYYAYNMGLIDIEGDEFNPAEGMLREDVILVLYRLGK